MNNDKTQTNSLYAWAKVANYINSRPYKRIYYHEGDIVWAALGKNIGQEQDGKGMRFTRPVLILHGYSEHLFFALPLTSSHKSSPYYFKLSSQTNADTVLLSQGKTLDTRRIEGRPIGKLPPEELEKVTEAFVRTFRKI